MSARLAFSKYHALGNAYLVLPAWPGEAPAAQQAARLCSPHVGIGSDGVLLGPLTSSRAGFRVRIFNPDGSEAEKSGNGLRIFARYLWDKRLVEDDDFTIETAGGVVTARVLEGGEGVRIGMGAVRFAAGAAPAVETLTVDGEPLRVIRADIGNPHCVVLTEEPSEAQARRFGPLIERHPLFPGRTNVQFMKVLGRQDLRLEIWERGAGYTLASGSSSCAAAAVARGLGLCDGAVTVHLRGGSLQVEIDAAFNATMTGSVTFICSGELEGNPA
jgi:diaminopimelate epimerase